MQHAVPTRRERLEHFLLRLIQQPGADQGHTRDIRFLLGFLKQLARVFRAIVQTRLFFYDVGILPRFHLGCQIISVGNVTVGGTGKTPVVEIFARELHAALVDGAGRLAVSCGPFGEGVDGVDGCVGGSALNAIGLDLAFVHHDDFAGGTLHVPDLGAGPIAAMAGLLDIVGQALHGSLG